MGEQRIWKLQAKCNNKSDAIDIINGENTWSYYYKNKCVDGEKIYYRCNKAKKREQQCPAGLYLLLNVKDEGVELYCTETDHDTTISLYQQSDFLCGR